MTEPTTDLMTEPTATDLTTTVDTYLAAYGETDAERRAELIAAVWDEAGRLVDPPFEGTGHAGISGLAETAHGAFPGHRFRRVTGIDAHHEFIRFGWELVAPDGTVSAAGTDFGEITADGRLRRIVGFFGDLPAED